MAASRWRSSLITLVALFAIAACDDHTRSVFVVTSIDQAGGKVCLHDVKLPNPDKCHPITSWDLEKLSIGTCIRATTDVFIPPKKRIKDIRQVTDKDCEKFVAER